MKQNKIVPDEKDQGWYYRMVLSVGISNGYPAESNSSMSSIITKNDGTGSTSSRSVRAPALIGAGVSGFLCFATTASAINGLTRNQTADVFTKQQNQDNFTIALSSLGWKTSTNLQIRRGNQDYTQVYAFCHSMPLISYRDLDVDTKRLFIFHDEHHPI
ncbi:cytochrome c1 family protein [Medicago truncatula]|uniref:Cytochrome c1 family protein n=1 Tax=Medicago truncatula TaxID=3880 RepID=G7KN97_MEDTR|nr:cytochrome c1 family protein [Medicago truncatula]